MMILGWPLPFLHTGQIDFTIHVYVKNIEKSIVYEPLKAEKS